MSDSIYFHAPCFDGIISAVIAWDHLETARGWKVTELEPVTYRVNPVTMKPDASWIEQPLSDRSAIVDFAYHPDAAFWVDHHRTTFIDETPDIDPADCVLRKHYERDRLSNPDRTLIFDERSPAGASLLWQQINCAVSDATRYAEMVRWATTIDSARYDTVEQAVFGDEPALQITQSLGTIIEPNFLRSVVRALRVGTLAEVAASPLIAGRLTGKRAQIEAGVETIRRRLQRSDDGVLASYETFAGPVPRYGAFLVAPEIRYIVSLVHDERGSKISGSRNPWGPATKAAIGDIFRLYGGGGHNPVGSLQLPPGNVERARTVFRAVIADIQTAELRLAA